MKCESLLLRLHRDESAQSVFVGMASLFVLVLAMVFPVNVGYNLHARIKLQAGADAAAYAAAVVLADNMSAVAWLNHMEAYLYHRQVNHCVIFCNGALAATMDKYDKEILQIPTKYPEEARPFFDGFMAEMDNTILVEYTPYIHDRDGTGVRVFEMYINTCRVLAESILRATPLMMRSQAMYMAQANTTGDVRMSFFPDDNTSPKLDFEPNRGHKSDSSFTYYESWGRKPGFNDCVDRAVAIGKKLETSGGTNSIKYIEGGDLAIQANFSPSEDWFEIWKGEPFKRGGKYTAWDITKVCWHPWDRLLTKYRTGESAYPDNQDHAPASNGHWHYPHWHSDSPEEYFEMLNFYFFTWLGRFIIPDFHSKGYHPGERVGQVWQGASGLNPNGGLPGGNVANDHHAWEDCEVCNNNGRLEFPASAAVHGVRYIGPDDQKHLGGNRNSEASDIEIASFTQSDHDFGMDGKDTEVCCYLEDALTDVYAHGYIRDDDFHHIFERNICPDVAHTVQTKDEADGHSGGLAPTIMLESEFFDYGVTVACWFPQETAVFGSIFGQQEGMIAVASAKAGPVNPCFLPPDMVCTGSEAACPDMTPFLENHIKGNLFHVQWDAKMILVKKAAPGGALRQVLQGTLYMWMGYAQPLGSTMADKCPGGVTDAFVEEVVH